MRQDRDDDGLDELRAALRADAASVAIALLGEPNKSLSTKSTLRWGGKGSLAVEVTGARRGLWFSYEATEGKDLLGLIRQQHGCSFPDAVAWARSHTGLAEPEDEDSEARVRREAHAAERRARQAEQDAIDQAKAEADRTSSIAWVQRVVGETAPIEGTPADWYLRQERGIARPAGGWPAAVRWHPRLHALVMVATLADGTVQRLQRVHLAPDGTKMDPDELQQRRYQAVKQTNGPAAGGAAARLPGDMAGPLLLAEGPETGLAAWTSTGMETLVALGAIGKLELPAGRRIVVLRDDDAKHSPGDGSLRRATAAWRKAGLDVTIATPWSRRRHDKSDLADVILAEGPDAVRRRVALALNRSGKVVEDQATLAEGRAAVDGAVGQFFARVNAISERKIAWDNQAAAATAGLGHNNPLAAYDLRLTPEQEAEAWDAALSTPAAEQEPNVFTNAIRVTVGVGKSHSARAHIVRVRAAMKARGDDRAIVVLVPAHALGDEQAAAFRAMPEFQAAGLTVATYRGRAAPDPTHPDYADDQVARPNKATMCGDLERVRDAQAIGLNAQTAVCARMVTQPDGTKAKAYCPLFHSCSYQAQRHVRADIWIAAHDVGFHEKPECMGEVAAVVVDEAAWRKGLIGAEGKPITLALNTLDHDDTVWSRKLGGEDREKSGRLRDLRRQLADVLTRLPDGPVKRSDLKGITLTAESCVEAFGLEFDRLVDPLHPGQTREQRKEAMEQVQGNTTVRRLSMTWTALRVMLSPGAPEASGWIELGTEATKEGQVRVVRLKGRSEIKDGWKRPTLLLDALLPPDLVQYLWPGAEMTADVRVQAPHQHIRQVTDKAFSLSMLAPMSKEAAEADLKEAQRRANRLRDLRAWIVRQARHYAPGRVLVVMQQGVEDALHKAGPLPSNVNTGHHNNIAGRDEWRDVRALIVVGRTLPGPGPIEAIREALTGEAVPERMDWYHRADAVRQMADGTTLPAEAECHADRLAESIRWQIAEGELVQIIGRGRGANRTEATPLDVFVLTDAPLPMPLAGVIETTELEPTAAELMMAAGGVVLENPADVGAAYPGLWGTNRDTVKSALRRGKLGAFPYRYSLIGECTQLRAFAYKAAGQGKSVAKGGYDPDLCPDPEAFIRAALGELTWFRIEGEGDEPKPPPKPSRKANAAPAPAVEDLARDDDDGESWPEPPEGHPAFDDPPPDPDWDRAWTLADEDRWAGWDAVDAEADPGIADAEAGPAEGSEGAVFSDINPARAACKAPHDPDLVRKPSKISQLFPEQLVAAGRSAISEKDHPNPLSRTCDVPWLHVDVPASPALDGTLMVTCPYCGEQHRHRGYGHRLAHCAEPAGRGYVLLDAGPASIGLGGKPPGAPGAARPGPW